VPHDVGGYFDFSSNDSAAQVRAELVNALNSMGLEVEFAHHEVALGQHEIDFRFADALKTADNVMDPQIYRQSHCCTARVSGVLHAQTLFSVSTVPVCTATNPFSMRAAGICSLMPKMNFTFPN
jgi:cystathionine beta-lyase family protein involved in aluminum resistance